MNRIAFFLLIATNGEETIRLYTKTPRKYERMLKGLGFHIIEKVRLGK